MTDFKYEGFVHHFGDYWDFEFTDGNPRHLYTMTYDNNNKEWAGVKLISETDDGSFEDDSEMSQEDLVAGLILIPMEDIHRIIESEEDS